MMRNRDLEARAGDIEVWLDGWVVRESTGESIALLIGKIGGGTDGIARDIPSDRP